MPSDNNIVKGRGAQINTKNPFLKEEFGQFEQEATDEIAEISQKTVYLNERPKKIVNKVPSPDLGFDYSMNPYQGCEHGCIYCYARNSHTYWGYSAGMDFEQKIIVKHNAAETLQRQLNNPKWKASPIMLSGNTDCYQPVERKLGITRRMLEVLLQNRHPVGIITKNELISRDIDILSEMAQMNLVHVSISINSLNEKLRLKLEPRTATYAKRLKTIEKLSNAGIPVNAMLAPIIPGLNSDEIPNVMKEVANAGAKSAAYIILRLNGQVSDLFIDWLHKQYPDRAEKILHQVADCHGGKLNDSRFGVRMKGEGKVADSIKHLFEISRNKYMTNEQISPLNVDLFKKHRGGQLTLF